MRSRTSTDHHDQLRKWTKEIKHKLNKNYKFTYTFGSLSISYHLAAKDVLLLQQKGHLNQLSHTEKTSSATESICLCQKRKTSSDWHLRLFPHTATILFYSCLFHKHHKHSNKAFTEFMFWKIKTSMEYNMNEQDYFHYCWYSDSFSKLVSLHHEKVIPWGYSNSQ